MVVYSLEEFEALDYKNLTILTIDSDIDLEFADLLDKCEKLRELNIKESNIKSFKFLKNKENLRVLKLLEINNKSNDTILDLSSISNLTHFEIESFKGIKEINLEGLLELESIEIKSSVNCNIVNINNCKKLSSIIIIDISIKKIDTINLLNLDFIKIVRTNIEKFYCDSEQIKLVYLYTNHNLKSINMPFAKKLTRLDCEHSNELNEIVINSDANSLSDMNFNIKGTKLFARGIDTIEKLHANIELKSSSEKRGWASIVDTNLFNFTIN